MIRCATVILGLLLIVSVSPAREWNVLDAGAVPDGKADCTAVFQKLLDEAGAAGGGIVHVPAGQYRIDGNLRILGGVTLQGTFRVPPTNRYDGPGGRETYHGSTLLAYAGRGSQEGEPFIRLAGSAATLAGFIVFYPEWKQTDVPPVPYPPCVLGQHYDNMAVLDCCLINPYEGIRFVLAGRNFVRNVFGYPIWRGLYIDQCYDIGRVENLHFWPFGVNYRNDDPYCKWINTEGTAFEFARTDWHYVTNTFCFGYGVGYKFSESAKGSCNGNFLGIGADSCRRPVLVEQAQRPGLLITNGEFVGRWGSTDSVCIEIAPDCRGKVSLANCSFWGPNDRCVWLRAPAGQFTASACNFLDWDNGNVGSPAIQLDAGRAILQGNTFDDGETHVRIDARVVSAIVMGNQAVGGLHVENRAGKRTQLLGNEGDQVEWTAEAREHYRVDIGTPGDARYLRRWSDCEPGFGWNPKTDTMRWSSDNSRLVLPVLPGTPYEIALDVLVPEGRQDDTCGLYLDGKRVAGLPASGTGTVRGTIPAVKGEEVDLELRVKGWVPAEVIPDSFDHRTLGVQARSLVMKARGAKSKRLFDANTGDWIEM